MHVLHKWSKWGPVRVRPMFHLNFRTGVKTPYEEYFQRRTCAKCEMVQEREVA